MRVTKTTLAEHALALVGIVDDTIPEERRSLELRQILRATANAANIALGQLDAVQPEINDDGEEE